MMKYLANGQAVELIAQLPDGRSVIDEYFEDSETGETFVCGSPYVVEQVYDNSPLPLFVNEVKECQAELDSLSKKLSSIRKEIREATEERSRILNKLKQVPALRRIEDFIDGKITHVVSESYGRVEMIPIKELVCESDQYYKQKPPKLKLITMFGNGDGSLSFGVNKYKDGSGSDCEAVLCCSEQDAIEAATELIKASLDKDIGNGYWLESAIESAKRIGIDIEPRYVEMYRDIKSRVAKENLDRAKVEFEKAQMALLKIEHKEAV